MHSVANAPSVRVVVTEPVEAPASFGEAIAQALDDIHKNKSWLCQALDMNRGCLSSMMTGNRPPPTDTRTIARMADVLGCSADDLCAAAGRLPPDLVDEASAVIRVYRAWNKNGRSMRHA